MTRRRPSRAQHPSSLPDHRWTTGLAAGVLGQPSLVQAYAARARILWRGRVPVAGVALEPSQCGGQPWWYAVIITRVRYQYAVRFTNKHTTRREAIRWIEQKLAVPLRARASQARAWRKEQRLLRRALARLNPEQLGLLLPMGVLLGASALFLGGYS